MEKKLQCIENVKKAGLKIVFALAIARAERSRIGDIVRLALEYIDRTSGISFSRWPSPGGIANMS